MEKSDFLRLFEQAVEIDAGTLTGSELLDQIDWDSLKVLQFVALVDEKFQRVVSSEQIDRCRTVDDLMVLALQKGNGSGSR